MNKLFLILLLGLSFNVYADQQCSKQDKQGDYTVFTEHKELVAFEVGQCIANCSAQQGQCIARCQGNGQCIGQCASDHGQCVASCHSYQH